MLSKIYVAPSTPHDTLTSLSGLVNEALESKLASETSARNALNKLQTAISKLLATAESPSEKIVESIEPSEGTPMAASSDKDEGDVTVSEVARDDESQLGEADAEGTILPDDDDAEDEGDTIAVSTRRQTDESLLDSLLDEDGDTVMG